jgi:hypothetical protein
MGENRDGYSGKRKGKGVVCLNIRNGMRLFEAIFNNTGSRDDLKNRHS